MCRALFIQNEKADIIHRIPLTTSNQFSFPAGTKGVSGGLCGIFLVVELCDTPGSSLKKEG